MAVSIVLLHDSLEGLNQRSEDIFRDGFDYKALEEARHSGQAGARDSDER
jgi:hypothetical protein